MPALLVVHDIDDVDHWPTPPGRRELVGARGYTVHTFVDSADPNRFGLVVEEATPRDFEGFLGVRFVPIEDPDAESVILAVSREDDRNPAVPGFLDLMDRDLTETARR